MVILKELQLVLMPTCFISISKEVFDKNRANNTGRIGWRGVWEGEGGRTWHHQFLVSKNKKGEKRKKIKAFKAEAVKRLSPSSKCYCFSHS